MVKRDLDKAASRFLDALRRISAGLDQQRSRIVDRAANAPRLLPGSQYEVVDLTGDTGNDLDYYIYELARLQDIGKSIIKVFGQPQCLVATQTDFESSIPNLRAIRDPLTHPNDNDKLDEVAWFSSAVKLKPDGTVEELVDPRYRHHEVAMKYHAELTSYLQAHVRSALQANPAKSLDQQIQDRKSKA